jgi:hypothetical protein
MPPVIADNWNPRLFSDTPLYILKGEAGLRAEPVATGARGTESESTVEQARSEATKNGGREAGMRAEPVATGAPGTESEFTY